MADNNLLETYNPLYDVHLRQYFASPHMQKHLRGLGLLDSNGVPVAQNANNVEGQLYARHQVMMDMMLRNRERVLMQLADLQKKLDAAEKVEIYRRIRSGITNADEFRRHHLTTRSFSRPARGRAREPEQDRQRRHSNSYDESELVKRIENDFDTAQTEYAQQHKSLYSRLAANAYKYQYLHKLDDRTLLNYKETLRRQLQKLERFREVSFGPHSVAKHQPNPQTSWFFRRRSLPSLTNQNTNANSTVVSAHQKLTNKQRNSKSVNRPRAGKSCSPHRSNRLPAANQMAQLPVQAKKPKPRKTPQKLPPLPKQQPKTKTKTSSGSSTTTQKLPPTAVVKPSKKREKQAEIRTSSGASLDKLPQIALGGALAGGAISATALAVSDPDPHPDISDTDYSQPETDASDALPSDASTGASPQPHSDIEPEHLVHEVEEIQSSINNDQHDVTPKEENLNKQMFSYDENEPIIEDPIHKEENFSVNGDFTPVEEEHTRHRRSVEFEPSENIENVVQEDNQYSIKETQNEGAYDSAIYSSDSNPLHEEQSVNEETPRSAFGNQSIEEDAKSEVTHNAEHSAFSPRNLDEENLSIPSQRSVKEEHFEEIQQNFDNRNETPMSKDSMEPSENSEQEVSKPESPINQEFEDQITPQEEMQRSIYHTEGSQIDNYSEHNELPGEISHESPISNRQDINEHQIPSEMSQSLYQPQENESINEGDEVSSVKDYQSQHRDSFAESESEPNLHYQTESIPPVENKEEHNEQNNFDLSHDTSIPTLEGESWRDSEEETRPVSGPLDGDSLTAVESLRMESSPQQQVDDNDSHSIQNEEYAQNQVENAESIHNDTHSSQNEEYNAEPIHNELAKSPEELNEDNTEEYNSNVETDRSIPVIQDEEHFERYESVPLETNSIKESSPPTSANNSLLVAQPSIEITPASDYSGSRENLERISEAATPEVPKTPSSTSEQNDDSGHPTEHDGPDSDHQLPEDEEDITPPSTRHDEVDNQNEDITHPSTGHDEIENQNEDTTFPSTGHGEIENYQNEDDIEAIPPPIHHSPLTVGEEKEESENYHLPESPDPNVHSNLIPEQNDDALSIPEIEDPAPHDHIVNEDHSNQEHLDEPESHTEFSDGFQHEIEGHQNFNEPNSPTEFSNNYESQHEIEDHPINETTSHTEFSNNSVSHHEFEDHSINEPEFHTDNNYESQHEIEDNSSQKNFNEPESHTEFSNESQHEIEDHPVESNSPTEFNNYESQHEIEDHPVESNSPTEFNNYESQHEIEDHPINEASEFSSNYESQHEPDSHRDVESFTSNHTAPDTERSITNDENTSAIHGQEVNFEDNNRNESIHSEQMEDDQNGNQQMTTTYNQEFQTPNGHSTELHEEEEVFNGLNGNNVNGSNGYRPTEEHSDERTSLLRKSVGNESDQELEDKEETGSVIIHGSPEIEHRKLEHHEDTGASQL